MYHDHSYHILGRIERGASADTHILEESEHRLGIKYPPSVAEWYRRGDAIEILSKHSNNDPPIAVADFRVIYWRSRILLPIRHENQGVCTWAIELDGSDDPPVLVDVDSGGTQWKTATETFSDYVYSCIWDYKCVFQQSAIVQAQNPRLSANALAILQRDFQQDVLTRFWPGEEQYRFGNSRNSILIWSDANQSDWFAAAPSAKGLEDLLQTIWTLDGVGNAFYDCSDEGRTALAEIVAKLP